MRAPVNAFVVLRGEGTSVVIDLSRGQLPAIAHWGTDLGELSVDEVSALVLAGVNPIVSNQPDEPVRLALLPEHHTGWLGRPGVSGSRTGRDWSPKFTSTQLWVDGQPVKTNSDAPTLVTAGAAVVEVEALDDDASLALAVTLELTQGGLLRSRACLTNEGEDDYQLDDLVLAYPVPTVAAELLDMAGRWTKERVPQRMPFTVGAHLRENRRGRTGPDAATVLHAGVPGFGFADKEVWGVHVGWSGNHIHYAERAYSGEQVIGGGELLLPGEVILSPADSYTTPWLYGSYGVGLDAVARRFHRYMRSRPQHPSVERPVTINTWEAVYFDHRLEPMLELAEASAAIGVERFVLDDGWFGSRRDDTSGLGDWQVSAKMWPTGLHPLVNRVRELGLQFGIWFEPDMVNLDSDVARAHPEWVMSTGNRIPVASRAQHALNLGIPECYAYVRDSMMAILGEYDIGYIKWDFNRDLVDAGTQPSGRPGVHETIEASYRLMDELRAAHPGLEIEACASGGARVDLGVLEHTDRVWASDCIDPMERQRIQRWTTQLLPPEVIGSHIASDVSHTTGRGHDLNFRAATAVFGHLGIEWDLRLVDEAQLLELAEWISFYKAERKLLFGGDLVRMDFPDDALVAFGVVAPDKTRAIYSFALIDTPITSFLGRLRFEGLDPDRRYRITPVRIGSEPSGLRKPAWWGSSGGDGVVLPGSALASSGLFGAPVNPEHAVLYLAETVD